MCPGSQGARAEAVFCNVYYNLDKDSSLLQTVACVLAYSNNIEVSMRILSMIICANRELDVSGDRESGHGAVCWELTVSRLEYT